MPLTGEAKREYQRKWIANRRAEFFKGKVCVKCGSSKNLELDHIDREKKISHKIWSWSKVRRLEELAKCQILCNTCHLVKTVQQLIDLYSYDEHGHCDNGHELALVGFYKSINQNGKPRKGCSYCHHIRRTTARNNKTKSLDEWIKFKTMPGSSIGS